MAIDQKLQLIHAMYYADKGITLDMLRTATESIARIEHLNDFELNRRLDKVQSLIKKITDAPSNG